MRKRVRLLGGVEDDDDGEGVKNRDVPLRLPFLLRPVRVRLLPFRVIRPQNALCKTAPR